MSCILCTAEISAKLNNLVVGERCAFETTMTPYSDCIQLFKATNIKITVEDNNTHLCLLWRWDV